ncbi:MAG: hypothetical protein H6737_28875 [Alphaproteobacteria bacterium]|nr:hypothetical protein [Alphaproteobacteria bacterium]
MRPVVPLSVLVGSTLLGVAVGALIGAELHVDVTVPEAVVERHTLHVAIEADEAQAQRTEARDARRSVEERERRERRERRRHTDAEVSRAELDALGDDLPRLGRALLHRGPDGEFDGYRLSAIRSDTLGDRVGLQNGDIVHAIDGHPLTSISEAMEAYAALADAERFHVALTRRGEPMSLVVHVR